MHKVSIPLPSYQARPGWGPYESIEKTVIAWAIRIVRLYICLYRECPESDVDPRDRSGSRSMPQHSMLRRVRCSVDSSKPK